MTNSRIPVAIVLTSLDPGGTERQMSELITRLDPHRFEVHVACFRREGLWLPKVERAAASVVEFRLSSFSSPATAARLASFAAWCRRRRIAVLQACDFYANVFALPGGALARVPVRIGSRRDILLPGRSGGQHRLQRYAYRFAHRVVANSRAAAAQAASEGVPERKLAVIPNGIDPDGYRPAVRRRTRRVITTVANLREGKGHDILFAAASDVIRQCPDVILRLVGDGAMREALEQDVRAKGLERHVEFLGHCEDVPDVLGASDLFVLPSRTEAFPNGLVEAMAAGLPSIASDAGGIPELIQHGVNGLLVPVGDAGALAAAIVSLIADGDRAAALGTAARRTIEARYSYTRMVADFEQLYLTELAGSPIPIRALYAR